MHRSRLRRENAHALHPRNTTRRGQTRGERQPTARRSALGADGLPRRSVRAAAVVLGKVQIVPAALRAMGDLHTLPGPIAAHPGLEVHVAAANPAAPGAGIEIRTGLARVDAKAGQCRVAVLLRGQQQPGELLCRRRDRAVAHRQAIQVERGAINADGCADCGNPRIRTVSALAPRDHRYRAGACSGSGLTCPMVAALRWMSLTAVVGTPRFGLKR